MTTTTITLLRHGLPDGESCFRGHTDFALTNTGLEQMSRAVSDLNEVDIVVCSPLQRCAQFARHFSADRVIPYVENKGLIELNFGDWDGQEKQQVWKENQQLVTDFWNDPWGTTPPEAEPLVDFDARVLLCWELLLTQYQGKHVLAVTHAGVIKQVMRHVLDMPRDAKYLQRLSIPYAALITIKVFRDQDGTLWPEVIWPKQY
ncbi:histidine phosphatase family protein [Vibrio maerlii]|uniref:histidine phosphatase family protein n=1 Tax=Vibrio maerlii TaxID=2231648 RepID=UPI000E3CA96C|nr:histidine phosphatase family protein [Vibrio maerlii]